MIYLIAGNYAQAKYWANQEKLTPNEWRYVLDSWDLRGINNSDVIREVGTPRLNSKIEEIRDAVRWSKVK